MVCNFFCFSFLSHFIHLLVTFNPSFEFCPPLSLLLFPCYLFYLSLPYPTFSTIHVLHIIKNHPHIQHLPDLHTKKTKQIFKLHVTPSGRLVLLSNITVPSPPCPPSCIMPNSSPVFPHIHHLFTYLLHNYNNLAFF